MPFDLLVVDLDNTLYAADNGVFARMDQRMNAFVCRELHVSDAQADALRLRYWREYGTTLRGLMLHHGVKAEAFLQDVHDIQAHEILQPDEALDQALGLLPMKKVIHTNGIVEHAERVLQALAVHHHFSKIYDIRYHDYMPKPCGETLQMLIDEQHVLPSRCLVIDDMQDNLRVAQGLGAATCWVSCEQKTSVWDYHVRRFDEIPACLLADF